MYMPRSLSLFLSLYNMYVLHLEILNISGYLTIARRSRLAAAAIPPRGASAPPLPGHCREVVCSINGQGYGTNATGKTYRKLSFVVLQQQCKGSA